MIRQGHNTQTLIPSVGDVSKRRVLSLLNCAECRAARAVRFEAIQPGCIWNSTAAENGARVVSRPAVRHSRAAFCIRKYYQRPASAGREAISTPLGSSNDLSAEDDGTPGRGQSSSRLLTRGGVDTFY